MLDMRLDYESYVDALINNTKIYEAEISSLKANNSGYGISNSEFDLLKIMTKDFNPDVYLEKFKEKEAEVKYNVFSIINSYCQPSSFPIYVHSRMASKDEYANFKSKGTIQKNNDIFYSKEGILEVMVKMMGYKSNCT